MKRNKRKKLCVRYKASTLKILLRKDLALYLRFTVKSVESMANVVVPKTYACILGTVCSPIRCNTLVCSTTMLMQSCMTFV